MNSKVLAVLIPLLYALPAAAIEPFTIKDIRVEGIQRTEAGTVFSYLPVKVGDRMDDDKADAAMHALFATGFFKDVNLRTENGVLVVVVNERPAIASVEVNGVKAFSKDQLRDNMKYVGLVKGRIFDRSALEKAEKQLKREYTSKGKYAVTVKTVVTPLERNRVAIAFNVTEGEDARIRQINIIGNHAFSEEELLNLDELKLGMPSMWSWFTSSDKYSKPKLSADLETLRSFYLDNGYLEFSIDSTQVSISSDKQHIFITINITEGPRYTVSDVQVAGPERILPHDEMRKLISVKPGDVFSRKALTESNKRISDRLGSDGYAFANVNAIPQIDKERHLVAFTFSFDPQQRVYVRNINVTGNTKTSDEVIRREFRQMEGAWFDTSKAQKSKQRVDRLDFFSDVNIETPQVQGTNDQVDVNVSVKEKSTGNFSVGAGINSGEGLVLMAGVTQANAFGTGNSLSTQLNTSKINRVASVSYTNPYYTDDGVSRGFDVYQRNTNTTRTNIIAPYTSKTNGVGVRYGIPIADEQNIHAGLAYENTTIGLTVNSPKRFTDYVNTFGATTNTYMGTLGWSHDSRDSAINTREGAVQSIMLETGLPVANALQYYKWTLREQWFYPTSQNTTFMFNGQLGFANGLGGKPLPFFRNYYGGGVGSVRGYDQGALGPVDSTGLSTGGNRMVAVSGELMFPMPGMEHEKSVRASLFVDGGAVYGPITQNTLPQMLGMRYSYGMAMTWLSPAGPLKISLGFPIHPQPGDKLQRFQFTLGTLF